jgi:hypothetical protein
MKWENYEWWAGKYLEGIGFGLHEDITSTLT